MNSLIQVHIADIHFGAIDPKEQYRILHEQFLQQISRIHFDILSIDGDLFDRKFMANSAAVYWANTFVHNCIHLCRERKAAFIMISGTESHEAGQLSLYKDLTQAFSDLEMYIIEHAQFVYTHGVKILCIPEEYGKGYDYYQPMLTQAYDMCFMHGTLVGGVYGANQQDLNARRPIFDIDAFNGCKGPIIAGHVHQAMCLKTHMYYVSNPIRYKFGEEQEKGYAIVVSHPYYGYFYNFMPINSFLYNTIQASNLGTTDPNQIIEILKGMQDQGIHVRLICDNLGNVEQGIISQYFMQSSLIRIERVRMQENGAPEAQINTTQEILDKYKGLEFLLDNSINEYEKLSRFIEYNTGSNSIGIDELKKLVM